MESSKDDFCVVCIRFHDGTTVHPKFKKTLTLMTVYNYVIRKAQESGLDKKPGGKIYRNEDGFELQSFYPKKSFSKDMLASTTLEQAGFYPNGTIIVAPWKDGETTMIKGEGTIQEAKKKIDIKVPDHRLRGESNAEKQQFKKRLQEKEAQEKKKEMQKKKETLSQLRSQIQYDKEERKRENWLPEEYKNNETWKH
jgi:hypothetical protein